MPWTAMNETDELLLDTRLGGTNQPSHFSGVYEIPTFYRNGVLVKLNCEDEVGYYVAAGDGPIGTRTFVLLDGTVEQIHGANAEAGFMLNTVEQAADYLRFFCGFLKTDTGSAFNIVEDLAGLQVEYLPLATVGPVEMTRADDTVFRARAYVEFDLSLHIAEFEVHTDGNVMMLDDELIGRLVPAARH